MSIRRTDAAGAVGAVGGAAGGAEGGADSSVDGAIGVVGGAGAAGGADGCRSVIDDVGSVDFSNAFDEPCELCPRRCRARRTAGELGICGADEVMRVARAALHFWEEPPISGTSGSGAIFFSGCSLRCRYCQNVEISQEAVGSPMTVDELAARMIALEAEGALNINLVTATHFTPAVREAVLAARERGLSLPIVWNTSGYETVETLRELADVVDVYLTDFKYASATRARELSGAADYPDVALAALEEMARQQPTLAFDEYRGQERLRRGVVARHLVLPAAVDEAIAVVELVHRRFGDGVRLSLMNQYTPLAQTAATLPESLRRPLTPEEYEAVLNAADALGVEDYYWQQESACGEAYIPAW